MALKHEVGVLSGHVHHFGESMDVGWVENISGYSRFRQVGHSPGNENTA
jgi:hypothetical protein